LHEVISLQEIKIYWICPKTGTTEGFAALIKNKNNTLILGVTLQRKLIPLRVLNFEIMKKLILLVLSGAALYQVAKYYKINSLEDVRKLLPQLKGLVGA
jgi:hypothetical protein